MIRSQRADSSPIGRSARRGLLTTAIALAAVVSLAAACGGSSKKDTSTPAATTGGSATTGSASTGGSASSSSTGGAVSGDPVVTMTIASVNYNGPTYESGLITAQAFEQYINANGGINGRPLKALTCDEKGVGTGSAACARQAVTEKAIAIVGSPTFYGGNVESVAHAAGLSVFGTCCSFTPNEFDDDTSFIYSPDPIASNSALLIKAVQDGCLNIASMEPDIPSADATNQGALKVAKAAGFTGKIKFIKMQQASTDYSNEVAEATKDNTDCLLLNTAENINAAVMPAFFSSGSSAKIYGTLGNLDSLSVKGFEDKDQIKNAVIESYYSSMAGDSFADFRQALKDFKGDTKGLVYDSLSGLGTWTAFEGFTQVAKAITGDITTKSFVEQAAKTKIDNKGQTGPIDFSKPLTGGIAPYNKRIFNRTFFFQKLDGTSLGTLDMQPTMQKVS
jgi:ABC-type branched-subunit amino acid transport system substrate-binding protein